MHTMMPRTVDRYTQMCNVYVQFKGEQFRVLSLTSFGVIKAPSASSDTWGGTKPGTEEQLKFSYVWSSTPTGLQCPHPAPRWAPGLLSQLPNAQRLAPSAIG